MNRNFIYAGIVAIIFLVIAYFEILPASICVTIALCAFVVAGSLKISDTLASLVEKNQEAVTKANDMTSSRFEAVIGNLQTITKSIDTLSDSYRESTNNGINQIISAFETSLKKYSEDIKNQLSQIKESFDSSESAHSQENSDLLHTIENFGNKVCEKISDSQKISELLNQSLKDRLEALNKTGNNLLEAFDHGTSELNAFGNSIKPLETILSNFDGQVKDLYSHLESSMAELVGIINKNMDESSSQLNILGESINKFTDSILKNKIENSNLSTEIRIAAQEFSNNTRELKKRYEKSIDSLSEKISGEIGKMIGGLKENLNAQSEDTGKIKDSVDKLCSNLKSQLKDLNSKVDLLFMAFDEMQNLSQSVQNSDKELLQKINNICKR
ncbi:MAG: hypothetical protein K1W14_05800 [Muribaculaceae bacterium]